MKYFLLVVVLSISVCGQNQKDQIFEQHTIDLFGGIGVLPFNINFGFGYFITGNIVGYTRVSALAVPIGFFDYSTNIGAKLIQKHGNSYVYSFEFGILYDATKDNHISNISFNNYHGIILKSGIGYKFQYESGLYIGTNFYLNLVLPNYGAKTGVLPELEVLLGIQL